MLKQVRVDLDIINSLNLKGKVEQYHPTISTHYDMTSIGDFNNIFNLSEKEKTMSVFNWYLLPAFDELSEPVAQGTITAKEEILAREYIVRSFSEENFTSYKAGDYVLVLEEISNW